MEMPLSKPKEMAHPRVDGLRLVEAQPLRDVQGEEGERPE
jgi:hypothetical protein